MVDVVLGMTRRRRHWDASATAGLRLRPVAANGSEVSALTASQLRPMTGAVGCWVTPECSAFSSSSRR
ncbi:uncharacterized protein CCOS01_14406 [Colletotrichum costaricense]|uniref:Uncharacterized protein n=1 Tax=Colletotrichum costaricense TaxID=1209916 RepID=A0AAJ0DUC8_9PEZI|nr:uncharacterized protein CCOS01_14406 [Colletotrichum costaricense]KAK1513464.1 hypothetical protein CCOS01_14406 [Colletotrichum costaricense]